MDVRHLLNEQSKGRVVFVSYIVEAAMVCRFRSSLSSFGFQVTDHSFNQGNNKTGDVLTGILLAL